MSALLQTQEQSSRDGFLKKLDELQLQLSALRDAYIYEKTEIQTAVSAISAPSDEYMTCDEVALYLAMEVMTVRAGAAGTRCLYQVRIKDGRNVRYPRAAVEMHRRNRMAKGKCGTCHAEFRKSNVVQMKK